MIALLGLALLVFLAVALGGYAASLSVGAREKASETLSARLSSVSGPEDRRTESLLKDRRLSQIGVFDRFLSRIQPVQRIVRLVNQAGLRKRVGEVLLYIPLLAILGYLIGMLLSGNFLICLILAGVGGSIPLLIVQRMKNKRMLLFSEQLPDTLDLLRASLQAGHSFLTALYVVADEFPDPIAEEFRTVAEEIRLGLPARDALNGLSQRVDDPNVPILVLGVLVTQEVGGNLAEVLDNIAYTIRERFKLIRETRVMTAQGRLSGMVLALLPFGVGLLLYIITPNYFAPLLETETGGWMIAYALISIFIGHMMIQRIVRIRV
jgi:tight adherence protein B